MPGVLKDGFSLQKTVPEGHVVSGNKHSKNSPSEVWGRSVQPRDAPDGRVGFLTDSHGKEVKFKES